MTTRFLGKLTICACAVLLAACGGGGNKGLSLSTSSGGGSSASSGSSNSGTASNTDSSTTDTGTTTNTNTTAPSTSNNGSSVVKYTDANFDKSMSFDTEFNWGGVATQQPQLRNTKHVLSGDQLDKVIVDGKEILLMKAAQTPRLNVLTEGEGKKEKDPITEEEYILFSPESVFQSSRGGYSYTWFGVVNRVREDIKPTNKAEFIDTMIAHGKLTDNADMPTTGKAEYKGHAIYYANGTTNSPLDPNKIIGTTQFNVDYGAKTVTGTIKADVDATKSAMRNAIIENTAKGYNVGNVTVDVNKVKDIAVEGKISGNGFSGTKNDVEVQGRFFGPKAAEMGGVFNSKSTDDILGAFGAKKQ
ncbi:transferrin-binding protein-like solute binding protein [Wielerella bovis]|uniref:transferrin-binding protein-like solute binding protein n=1 Tax=Wielerella bovis TaxID=2917790 RepID=UPI00201A15D5|nr:transferrin-binding protein-like solute binding protein [Wielerella bovis]MCG7657026.1 transferrin-binding protein-like solute binding protein [Wielerella bovis]MCG7659249.1 transferrin-binding protein-like solute binding protein [Wielerella bovis]